MVSMLCLNARTQVAKDENFVKASLIFNFLEETEFSNEKSITQYQIDVYNAPNVFSQLNELSQTQKIKNKQVKVNLVTSINQFSNSNLIYIPNHLESDAQPIFNDNQTALIITDELESLNFSHINFYKTSQNKIQFSVNSKNFTNRQFTPSVKLLVYANANQETLDLIERSEKELVKIKEDYQKQLNLSKQINKKIHTLITDVKKKEDYISNLVKNINIKQKTINDKDSILQQQNELNKIRQNEYLSLKNELNTAKKEIQLKQDSLLTLQNNLLKQSQKIKANNEILAEQSKQIESQKNHLIKTDKKLDRTTKNLWILALFLLIVLILLYFIIRENTAKKATLKLVAEQNLKIVEASKHKDEFISNLSHEVRTPLNAIIGYTNLVAKNTQNQEDLKYLNHISLSSKNLLGIINDILDLKKIESGKSELELINFDLKSVISDSFNSLELLAHNKGLKYILNYDDALPNYVKGDPLKLNQVFLNLLGNAIKFTDNGYVKLTVKLIRISNQTHQIKFQITDTGTGIEAQKLALIFDSFTQENKSISNRFGGTGLGLTISQKFVELMGGKIEVESGINKGTNFSFLLDFEQAKTSAILEDESTTVIIPSLEKMSIIYADDMELNRLLLEKQFNKWNQKIKIVTVENGKELVEACQSNQFNIVLTDIRMPIMDGVEATKLIRKFDSKIPVIGVSANALATDIKSYLKLGMNDYMLKPYQFNELLVKMAQLLNLKYEVLKDDKPQNTQKVFKRIWRMSDSNEEYLQILNDLRNDIKENLSHLKQNAIDYENAHQLVNKVTYFGDDKLLKLCQKLDKKARTKNEEICEQLFVEIEQIIKPYLQDV